MQVREFMSKDPVCCNPESSLGDVARLMGRPITAARSQSWDTIVPPDQVTVPVARGLE